eukprot:TRINITY_DN1110_c0_g2_i2.p1 TRINITY_DN1110_c0_g2~~TRINITY_DN1110_c0_g2_i2.p1  ORF type:complete len:386 (+),score=74.40 TRINITY_DN1110_c0_g2_i2:167-1159(+)
MAKRERRQNTMDTASNSLQPAAASQPEQPSGFRLQSLGCSIEPPASSLEILASSLQLQALSSHTANTSIGLSPQAPDTDEEQDWWTPVGISDEQGYSPDCSCDGDDPVNNAGRRDLTDWWNSGKRFQEQYAAPSWMLDANTSMGLSPEAADSDDGGRRDLTEWWKSGTRFQEQYPAPSWTGAVVGHFSTFMHGNIPLHECHCDACGSTSGKDLLAQRAPPRPCLLTSLLPRCARAVSCDSDDLKNSWILAEHISEQHEAPSWMHAEEAEKGSHCEVANVQTAGSYCSHSVRCCFASSREEDEHDDCEYNGWNPGGIADADEGYAPSCPCP